MHIPDSMLNGSVCPVTATLSVVGIAGAVFFATKAKQRPSAKYFGAITALIFMAQMVNFPILNGTSGHLLGGVLAAALLGTSFGVLCIALVVTIQSLLFSDGGISVLGANIFNMAIIGAGAFGLLRSLLRTHYKEGLLQHLITPLTAWLSVFFAAFAVSVELAVDGKISFATVLPAMLGVHALIGFGEAGLTALAVYYLKIPILHSEQSSSNRLFIPLWGTLLGVLILTPFASGYPDGLEWVAEKYAFLHQSAPTFVAPLSGYLFPSINNEIIATGIAGLMGAFVSFSLAWFVLRFITFFSKKVSQTV